MNKTISIIVMLSSAWLAGGCGPGSDPGEVSASYVAPRPDFSRACGPVKVTPEEMRLILAAARRGADAAGAANASLAQKDKNAARNVVIVSIYARDARGRPLQPFPAIEQAGGADRTSSAELAGRRAARRLGAGKWINSKSAFKIDLPGTPGPVRTGRPQLDGGLDGLLLMSSGGRRFHVPGSLYLADTPSAGRYLGLATAVAGLTTSRPAMHRTFRSTSFANIKPGGKVLPLYRGNVLLKTPDAGELLAAARAGGRWLVGALRPSGRYYYRYYPVDGGYQEDRYSLARHCGTAWGLYILYDRTGRKDAKLLATANRSLDWMRELCREKGKRGFARLPRYQTPGPTASSAALALLALVEACRLGGRKELLPEAVTAGDLIIKRFQHPSGRFWSWWDARTGRPAGELAFIYHPGELILGLAGLYEISGKKRFLDAAVLGMEAQVRAESLHLEQTGKLPPDAWTIQAVEALERVAPPRKEWRAHAWLLADWLVKGQHGSPTGPEPKSPDYAGGMNNLDPPIACAAGSRGEGLISACRLAIKAGEAKRADFYRSRLLAAARFALEGQYRPDNSFWLPDPARARGGVRQSLVDTTVRIDYVQHCIATWLGAAEILKRRTLATEGTKVTE
jgi:hypothetical protein